jgi:hypothetical protein
MSLPMACLIAVTMMADQMREGGCCPVLELPQYTMKPGQRDVLIDLFDRHFIESQQATGMTLVGQFRDRDRPDRFVWLRGFETMERRHATLDAFYGGPVSATHRTAANATMLDSTDVLLLKPPRAELAFRVGADAKPSSRDRETRTVLAGIYQLPRPTDSQLVVRFERDVAPHSKRTRSRSKASS